MKRVAKARGLAIVVLALIVSFCFGMTAMIQPIKATETQITEVDGLTPWSIKVANCGSKLNADGTYQLGVTGGFGTRVAIANPVDFTTMEFDMNLSKISSGLGTSSNFITFVKGENKYPTEDTSGLTFTMEKRTVEGVNEYKFNFWKSWLEKGYNDANGVQYNTTVSNPANDIITFKVVRNVEGATYDISFNTAKLSFPIADFEGDSKIFIDGVDITKDTYMIFGGMGSYGEMGISELRDSVTTAYNTSITSKLNAINDYKVACDALEETTESVIGAENLKAKINVEGLRAYTLNQQNAIIATCDAKVSAMRLKLSTALLITDINSFETAVNAVNSIETMTIADEKLSKIDLGALEALTDTAKKTELTNKLNTAKSIFVEKIDAVINTIITDIETKTNDLTNTTKLREAVSARSVLTQALMTRVSADNSASYTERLVACDAKISSGRTIPDWKISNGGFTTKMSDSIGFYSQINKGEAVVPEIFLNKKVSATNFTTQIKMNNFGTGWFSFGIMEKPETFYATDTTDVTNNKGIFFMFSKASATTKIYDVAIYIIKPTSINFGGSLITTMQVPVKDDGLIDIRLYEKDKFVEVEINGEKLISSKIKKTEVQLALGVDGMGYAGYSTGASTTNPEAYFDFEITKMNNKNILSADITTADPDNLPKDPKPDPDPITPDKPKPDKKGCCEKTTTAMAGASGMLLAIGMIGIVFINKKRL